MKLRKVKSVLLSAIEEVSQSPSEIVVDPERDFTRKRKLPLDEVIRCTIAMGGSSLKHELLDILGYSQHTATSSAFIQQRVKLKPEAFKKVLDIFNTRCNKLRKKEPLRILAVDGTDIQIATNPKDSETFFPGHSGQTPFNLLHLNAMYDLDNRIYTDVTFGRKEHAAFVEMVDSSDIHKALVIADRGYEAYNNMAHIQEKGWYFLIRIKDGLNNGIKSGFAIPEEDVFDMPVELNITRKQTKAIKELLKDRNNYRFISHTTPFDYLPSRSRKKDPDIFYLLKFRIVRLKIKDDLYETLLTNLDTDEYPPGKLKELYHLRWPVECKYHELKYRLYLEEFNGATSVSIRQEFFINLLISNLAALIKGNADEKIENSANPKNRYRYQANRTFIIGRIRKLFPKILIGQLDLSALDQLFRDACKNKSQLQPGRRNKRQRIERKRKHFRNRKVTV